MKTYTVTRICKNSEGNTYFNEVVAVFANRFSAEDYCNEEAKRAKAAAEKEVIVDYKHESKGVWSYEVRYKSLTDYSSLYLVIKEFEVQD